MVKLKLKQEQSHAQGSSAKTMAILKKAVIAGVSLFFAGAVFMSCSDESGEVAGSWNVTSINATGANMYNGGAYSNPKEERDRIDSVKMWVGKEILSRTRYTNGGFTANLPANVDSRHLMSIESFFSGGGNNCNAVCNECDRCWGCEECWDCESLCAECENCMKSLKSDLKFSDKKAQITEASLIGYVVIETEVKHVHTAACGEPDEYKDCKYVEGGTEIIKTEQSRGLFYFGDPGKGIEVSLVYVDRDVTVTGGSLMYDADGNFTGNVSSTSIIFKKGWNFCYVLDHESDRGINSNYVTTNPDNSFKWYFVKDWNELK